MENGESLARCEGHTASVTKCVLFSDDRLIASSSFDGYLRVSTSEVEVSTSEVERDRTR